MTLPKDELRVDDQDGLAWITLARPQARNAMDAALAASLLAIIRDLAGRADVRVIAITGAGGAFSAGQDVSEMAREVAQDGPAAVGQELRLRFQPLILAVRRCQQPVIAAIDGPAAGAGLGLALACDLRVASTRATLHPSPVRLGLIPGSGISFLLPRLIGASLASDWLLRGSPIGAEEALAAGLVHRVVPPDGLRDAVEGLADELMSGSPIALGLTKRALDASVFAGLREHLEWEAQLQEIAASDPDHRARLTAFLERQGDPSRG